jgi:hypothetical protein
MSDLLTSRFAVGSFGKAHSSVFRVSANKQASLYCGVRFLTGEIKSSIHAPRPPTFPHWERHYGFPLAAKGEVAKKAKLDGGPHKAKWTGSPLAGGYSLEWRIIFPGWSLSSDPMDADPLVTLLPLPGESRGRRVGIQCTIVRYIILSLNTRKEPLCLCAKPVAPRDAHPML